MSVGRLLRSLRRVAGAGRPQSVRVRITLVAVLITTAAVSAGGWLLIRSVEGGQRNEIRQDNEDLIAMLADELRSGVDVACLDQVLDPEDVGTAQVNVVDQDGNRFTFGMSYDSRTGGSVMQSEGGATAVGSDADAGADGEDADEVEDEPPPPRCCQEEEEEEEEEDPPIECTPDDVPPEGQVETCVTERSVPSTTDEPPAADDPPVRACSTGDATGGDAGGGRELDDTGEPSETDPADEPSTEASDSDEPSEADGTGEDGSGEAETEAEPSAEAGVAADALPLDGMWPDTTAAADVESISQRVSTADGEVMLTVVTPIDQVTEAVNAVRGALLVGLPLGVALVALASWLLVGRALRPVEAIRVEAEAIGGSTLDRRLPEAPVRDEINRLAQTMNAMLARLEGSARRQRQFVADASHELRSPLAAIRTDLEVALLEGDAGNWRAAMQACLREEARLETLIADLLVLARDDESAVAAPTTPVDVAGLAEEESDRPRRLPVTVTTNGHGPAVVPGNARQLRQVVSNLLDNADRHARDEVRIAVHRTGNQIELVVDDDGAGIPPADRQRVFERFTRLDDGRAREDGGAGLGLAVVRSIVLRHGGTVEVHDNPARGARLVVTLPSLGGA